jgi:hypothetical protein
MTAALVLGLAAGEASGWPFLRQPLENAMTRAAAVPVQLQGAVKLHLLWRPRLEVEHLRLGRCVAVAPWRAPAHRGLAGG